MKLLYVFAGTLALALGFAGAVLPLLPATPFFLLAAACYARGSAALHRRLLESRFPGKYLKSYLEKRGVPAWFKIFTLVLLWSTLLFSALHPSSPAWRGLLLVAVGGGVTIHILRLRTARLK